VSGNVERLVAEVKMRFPEIIRYWDEVDDEMPYLLTGYIVDWLVETSTGEQDEILLRRVKTFWEWANAQPRSTSADDDICTIVVVAFLEALFFRKELWWIIPNLVPPEALKDKYWIQWVGKENYEEAKRYFKEVKENGGVRALGHGQQ
jgi:hypothetical protein